MNPKGNMTPPDGTSACAPVVRPRAEVAVAIEQLWSRYTDLREYVGWSDEDSHRLMEAYDYVRPHLESLVDDFYAEIQRHAATRDVLGTDETVIARLKGSLAAWMQDFFAGRRDAEYVARRWRVGLRHVEIGLPHVYAMAALSRLGERMAEILWASWKGEPQKLFLTMLTLHKSLCLDASIIGDAYEQERVRLREEAERRRMEDVLNEERELNSGLLAFAGAVAIVLDEKGRIVRGNRRFETLLGYELDRLHGEDWLEQFLDRHDALRWRTQLFGPAPNGLAAATTALSGPKGAIHVHWSGSAVRDADGRTRSVIVIGNDISELHDAQRRATQAERLAALGEMATGLAHESRAALQRIGWAAETLEADLALRGDALEQLAKIRRSQEQLRKLFEDVRAYASPPTLEREPVRLSQTWREAWDLIEPQRKNRDVQLGETLSQAEPYAFADRVRLVQVFTNLFENAIAATGDPVRIDVSVQPDTAGSGMWRIAVRDNGPGLNIEQRRRLFEPFYTTKPTGTGLGLSICRRIVEAHGGTIETADASPGAEFVITLPAAVAEGAVGD